MAFILLKDNQKLFMPADKAEKLWTVFNGDIPGTLEQQAFCKTVHEIYLNWRNESTPKSYLKQKREREQAAIGIAELFPGSKVY